jgi:alkyl sulfatase BDS1-like metallo-beta-lactamase superfamily hydrolase
LFESGRASIEGNQTLLQQIVPNLDNFDSSFEIMPLLKN